MVVYSSLCIDLGFHGFLCFGFVLLHLVSTALELILVALFAMEA